MHLFFNRNIALIKRDGPDFLRQLGYTVRGSDWYGFNLRGGRVSFIVSDYNGHIFMFWLQAWFGKIEADAYEEMSPMVRTL